MFFFVDAGAHFAVAAEVLIPLGQFGQFADFALFAQFVARGFAEVDAFLHFRGFSLKSRVLVHFGPNHQLKVENRSLKDFKGLEHLRSERLLHPLLLD